MPWYIIMASQCQWHHLPNKLFMMLYVVDLTCVVSAILQDKEFWAMNDVSAVILPWKHSGIVIHPRRRRKKLFWTSHFRLFVCGRGVSAPFVDCWLRQCVEMNFKSPELILVGNENSLIDQNISGLRERLTALEAHKEIVVTLIGVCILSQGATDIYF